MMAELLAVAVVVLVIFTVLLNNLIPTKGEYERRLEYNDIDTLYANYYLKILLLKYFYNDGVNRRDLNLTSDYLSIITDGECNTNYSSGSFTCNSIKDTYGITDAVITKYKPTNYNGPLKDYINYLDIPDASGELLRLTIKTSKGYSSDQFYSKICNNVTYSDWSSYTREECTGSSDVCEKSYKEVNLYNNGTSKPVGCDTNPLCYLEDGNYYIITYPCTNNCNNETYLFRTKQKYVSENDSKNFSISPC